MLSPCVKRCNLREGVCIGCHRTLDEIITWRDMTVDDRMRVLREIQSRTSTHNCPSCGGPAYCAMEDGKSANLCWCMEVDTKDTNPMADYGTCLCRKCLTQ